MGFNPLIRGERPTEALAVLSVLATAIFALPVAAQAGTMFYDAGVRTVDEQAHSRHSVEAVAVEDSATVPAEYSMILVCACAVGRGNTAACNASLPNDGQSGPATAKSGWMTPRMVVAARRPPLTPS